MQQSHSISKVITFPSSFVSLLRFIQGSIVHKETGCAQSVLVFVEVCFMVYVA